MSDWPELRIDIGRLRQRENLADLKKRTQADVTRTISSVVAANGLEITTARIPEGAPVRVEGVIDTAMAGIEVRCTVTSEWEGECRRCLDIVTEPVELDLSISFLPNLSENDDSEAYPIISDVIDVGEVVREELMLGLPLSPLCKNGCVGADPDRFPTAGASHDSDSDNEDGSQEPPLDPRWAALSQIQFDEE